MVHQPPVVQIDRADHGVFVVGKIAFGVDKARPVFVDLYTGVQKTLVMAPGHLLHQGVA